MQNEFFDSKNNSQQLLNKDFDRNSNNVIINNPKINNYNNINNLGHNNENIVNTEENLNNQVSFNLYFFIRSFIVVIIITLISLNTVYGFALPHGNIQCIEDKVFIATEKVNKYFYNNATARHILIIFSSLCVDFAVIYMCVIWCLWGKSWRVFVALFGFYMLRGIIQSIFQMSYPEGYIWEYPGFPSIMVSYLKTNDFFYSGHVGLPMILMCEFHILKNYYMYAFCIITFFVEFFTMLVMRGHYTIDLITGAIFAHYIFQNVSKHIHYIDNLTFKKLDKENNLENAEEEKNNNSFIKNPKLEYSPVPIRNLV